ncbi:hypothetical protein GCM10022261_03260 [Brevibacterium daeguense]|uniref:Uncharacterized protein n=1 Tax=Brevibacterium daeguense TaxID=909936 RepID=A0ABP8EG15_9MICO|nr:hypothetical protein [Brevibacterium daeguense]
MNTILGLGETVDEAQERLNSDQEFRLKARKWEGRFKIVHGETVAVFQMHEGAVERIELNPSLFTHSDFQITASEAEWEKLLQETPEPFYQDIYSAWLHHGFSVDGDLEQFFAFHMALRRLQQILRTGK